jgi:hypothetical protein
MKSYVMTTGMLFGLLVVVHIWRILEEGRHLASDPFYILITTASAAFCIWACRLLRTMTRDQR